MSMVETERKFSPTAGQAVPELGSAADLGDRRVFELRAVYYDTIDFAVTRFGAVLRRREGGHDEGWHLKLPRGGDQRLEVHAPLEIPLVPRQLREHLIDIIGAAALFPVAELVTTRTETDLLDRAGQAAAVLCDDEVIARVGVEEQRWHELEVELTDGDPVFLEGVSELLLAAGIPRAGSGSKIAHALAGVVDAGARQPGAESPAGEVVARYLATQVGVLQARQADVVTDAPDAVHRSRVATRRLRSALKTFGPLLRAKPIKRLRRELKWHAELLGEPRDAEVLSERILATIDTLDPSVVEASARSRIAGHLDALHRVAHTQLVNSMETQRYIDLMVALMELLGSPPWRARAGEVARDLLPGLVGTAYDEVARSVEAAQEEPDELDGWHEVRKVSKAARYCSEAMADAFDGPAEEAAQAWEAVTEALGELQDTVVAVGVIDEIADDAEAAGESLTTYQALEEAEIELQNASLGQGKEALSIALSDSLRAWTRGETAGQPKDLVNT